MKAITLCHKPGCRGCPVVEVDGNRAIISENFDGNVIKLAELDI